MSASTTMYVRRFSINLLHSLNYAEPRPLGASQPGTTRSFHARWATQIRRGSQTMPIFLSTKDGMIIMDQV